MAYKSMTAKFHGVCKACKGTIDAGEPIVWESLHKSTFHPACKPAAPVVVPSLMGQAKVKAKTQKVTYPGKLTAGQAAFNKAHSTGTVSYTHLRAHETPEHLVCR